MAEHTIIAVIAAGAMGGAVGQKLVEGGYAVLTNLDGRSDATRKRAAEAGMIDSPWSNIVQKADLILSIIPPSDAVSFAQRLLAESKFVQRTNANPLVFADCNAVNVDTIQSIAGLFADTSIIFVDASIIGGPPSGTYSPTFYGSADSQNGTHLKKFQNLVGQSGIKVRILDGKGSGVGNASALKMSYAGISKGLIGLFATQILAAHNSSPATSEALLQELSDSQPDLLIRIKRSILPMIPKAYRWIGEMEEIAGFVGRDEKKIFEGFSEIFRRVETSVKEKNEDIEVLKGFVEAAKRI